MTLLELFLIAVGLSMDAFAVSVCKGLSVREKPLKTSLLAGLYFGGFQALMPLVGYLLGVNFKEYITSFDHWIAFVLLSVIGFNMIKEAKDCDCEVNPSTDFKNMIMLAVATSIDALAVGVTFAFLSVKIIPAISFIGATTFVLSMLGVKIGSIFGIKYKAKAEISGGVILICMGLKILVEHLFF